MWKLLFLIYFSAPFLLFPPSCLLGRDVIPQRAVDFDPLFDTLPFLVRFTDSLQLIIFSVSAATFAAFTAFFDLPFRVTEVYGVSMQAATVKLKKFGLIADKKSLCQTTLL